ncbi:MAG: DUF4118 domain-containing protein [Chloroflexi bacterium]|nr:DUF4118 domain-containing protein [Chloroflexota bacterium]
MGTRRPALWVGYLAALLAVAVVSVLVGAVLGFGAIANISMLYLIAVLSVAAAFGSGPAILASVASFLSFDWFFVHPVHTFAIASAEEWVALVLFLFTAIITGQLAAGQRRRAQEAEQRERDAVVLYDVVRLLGEPDLAQALAAVAERLRGALGLSGVVIELEPVGGRGVVERAAAGDAEAVRMAQAGDRAPHRVMAAGAPPAADRPGAPGRWRRIVPPAVRTGTGPSKSVRSVVPVLAQGQRVGSLILVTAAGFPAFAQADDRLLSAAAAQLGQAAERRRLRREAVEAEILRRSDDLKTALLNAVSHDLRTPLASIIAAASSLLQQDVAWSDEERREFAQAIEEQALRLNRIVGNLLDLSRMEAGVLRPDKRWRDISALIDDVLGRLRPLTAHHLVRTEVEDGLPPLPFDYIEIDQTLSNLLENAVKYTPPGAEIVVRAHRRDGDLLIDVADRGPGIPAAALHQVLSPFYRVESKGQRPQGTGLGLAVARGLVEAHGGRLWVENRAGGGARFSFTLPLGDEDGAASPGPDGAEAAP